MNVSSLKLEDIRSFGKSTLQLSAGINLLVGNNNSDKSTIIMILFSLQDRHSLGVEDIRRGKDRDTARIEK
jgi:recombinational DNA repair ATPase RecF